MNGLLGLLFPVICLGCGSHGMYLCVTCIKTFKFDPEQRCAVCNKKSITGATHFRCKTPRGIDGVWAMAEYKGLLKLSIHKWKYGYASNLSKELAVLMVKYCPSMFKNFDLLMPIPLHESRYRWRGFNQASDLGMEMSKLLAVPFNGKALLRVSVAKSQMQIKEREKRLKNLKGVFEMQHEVGRILVKGKSILLVDDIATTGTTLREVAKILKSAGASKVWGWVVAR